MIFCSIKNALLLCDKLFVVYLYNLCKNWLYNLYWIRNGMVAAKCCQKKQQRDTNSSTRKHTEMQDVKWFFKNSYIYIYIYSFSFLNYYQVGSAMARVSTALVALWVTRTAATCSSMNITLSLKPRYLQKKWKN